MLIAPVLLCARPLPRAAPGTHKPGGSPADYIADPQASHTDERLLVAPAGTVAVFNAQCKESNLSIIHSVFSMAGSDQM